jgi:hypothetical protein
MNQTDRKNMIQEGFRLAQRNATCRICGEIIQRGVEMLAYRAHGSRDLTGQVCVPCIETIAEIVREKKSLNSV